MNGLWNHLVQPPHVAKWGNGGPKCQAVCLVLLCQAVSTCCGSNRWIHLDRVSLPTHCFFKKDIYNWSIFLKKHFKRHKIDQIHGLDCFCSADFSQNFQNTKNCSKSKIKNTYTVEPGKLFTFPNLTVKKHSETFLLHVRPEWQHCVRFVVLRHFTFGWRDFGGEKKKKRF